MIYIDPLRQYPGKQEVYCHMATDGDMAELHAFAIGIGLKRHWFQAGSHPHYDLVASKRELAVRDGAKDVSSVTLFRRCFGQL